MRPANSHQWTSLIRLAYSLAPKGNRNLPQRRNFEVMVLPHPSPPKQQTGKCPVHGIPAGHIRKSQFVIAASSADRPNTNAALPSAALGWRFKPELLEAVDQRELLSMTTPRLTGGSKCVWPLRAARTRLETDGPGSVWSAGFTDLPSVRSCRRLTGLGGATGLVPSMPTTAGIPLLGIAVTWLSGLEAAERALRSAAGSDVLSS